MNKKQVLGRRGEAIAELTLNLRRFIIELLLSNFHATEQVGLNSTDIGTMCVVLLHGPTPAGRLAELTGLTTGAITGVVDRLETAGFVRREADPSDRRKVIVMPEPRRVERDLFPHFSGLSQAASEGFYEDFTIQELEVITDFLSRLSSLSHEQDTLGPTPSTT